MAICSAAPRTACLTKDMSADGLIKSVCEALCGNANLDPNEGCDDGNVVNGEGCSSSSTCKVEAGYRCTQPLLIIGPSVCYRSLW